MLANSFGREEKAVLQERGVTDPYPLVRKLPPSIMCLPGHSAEAANNHFQL